MRLCATCHQGTHHDGLIVMVLPGTGRLISDFIIAGNKFAEWLILHDSRSTLPLAACSLNAVLHRHALATPLMCPSSYTIAMAQQISHGHRSRNVLLSRGRRQTFTFSVHRGTVPRIRHPFPLPQTLQDLISIHPKWYTITTAIRRSELQAYTS